MQSIENELKERLNKDIYGVYNIPFKKFDDVLDMQRNGVAAEEEEEEVSIVPSTCRHGLFLCSCARQL
jgi:protein MAK16